MFGRMRRTGSAALFAFAVVAFGAACNAVLGLDDLQPRVDAGTPPDASSGGPLRIANPGVPPTCLVLQLDRIYYCIGQRVIVAKRDGSEARDFAPDGGVGTFAIGPAGACWTSNGALVKQTLDGGSPTVVVGGGVLDSVACAGPFAYFAATTDAGGVEVRRLRIDIADQPVPVMAVSALDSMATAGFDVVVADENRASRITSFGIVVDDAGNAQLDGSSVVSVDATAPRRIAAGGTSAYWVRGSSANVDMTKDFLTTASVSVAHSPSAIAVYGEDIYTVSESDGLVLRRTPTDTKIVATGQNGVHLIAVDDLSIAWATSSAIFILPRL